MGEPFGTRVCLHLRQGEGEVLIEVRPWGAVEARGLASVLPTQIAQLTVSTAQCAATGQSFVTNTSRGGKVVGVGGRVLLTWWNQPPALSSANHNPV